MLVHFDHHLVSENICSEVERKPHLRLVRATRSPTVTAMVPSLMIRGRGVEVNGGGGGGDQDASFWRPASCKMTSLARQMSVWLVSSQWWLLAASRHLLVDPRIHRRHLELWRFTTPSANPPPWLSQETSANYLHDLLPSGHQRSRLRILKTEGKTSGVGKEICWIHK